MDTGFERWWAAAVALVRDLGREFAAADPPLVAGFLSRAAAEAALASAPKRAFLLRVSESRAGALVASFVDPERGGPAHCLITVRAGAVSIALGSRQTTYASLRGLVFDSRNLATLCPGGADKRRAFAQLDDR